MFRGQAFVPVVVDARNREVVVVNTRAVSYTEVDTSHGDRDRRRIQG